MLVKNLKRRTEFEDQSPISWKTRNLDGPIIYDRMKMIPNKINSELRLDMLWLILSFSRESSRPRD